MPIFTVYAKILREGKHTHKFLKTPVHTIFESPVDWQDLKTTMLDAARNIYRDHDHKTTSEITLERHLPGRYVRGMTSYRESRIRYKRQFEFKARITYLYRQDQVKIECAAFGPLTWPFAEEYWTEKGKKWQIPRVVPAGFEASLQNPAIMFTDLLMKTASYAAEPRNLYGSQQERRNQQGLYAATPRGLYAGRNYSTVEQDREEKENEI